MVGTETEAERPESEAEEERAKVTPVPTRQSQTREQSSIQFPYGDLNDAVAIARAIHENAGLSCSRDQLAAYMGQPVTSGTFRENLSTANVFGVIETDRGLVRLTDLGRRIVDPNQERGARSDAFLHVPLYERIFESHRGHTLPPASALQNEMIEAGVATKQAPRARQAFDRSADQAGFFEHGRDRLVQPAVRELPPGGGGNGGGGGNDTPPPPPPAPPAPPRLHNFIEGLIETLPEPGSEWSGPDRRKWLQTAANIFDLIYEGEGGIEVRSAVADRSPRPFDN